MEIKNLYDSIEHSRNESVKVVEKAKASPKVSAQLLGDLELILQAL
jgi:hypothetical protein